MSPSTEVPEAVAKSRDHLPDEERFRVIHSEDVEWRIFPAFPPEARLAVLVGDPTKPAPYVIRVKLVSPTWIPPTTLARTLLWVLEPDPQSVDQQVDAPCGIGRGELDHHSAFILETGHGVIARDLRADRRIAAAEIR
jgi:hypothetical protein